MKKPSLQAYIIEEYGSEDGLYKAILGDFFRHGFDGSGADNFFDAGSCVDGRLTSCWAWSSSLEKKRYFPIFLLTGMFLGYCQFLIPSMTDASYQGLLASTANGNCAFRE